MMVFGEVCRDKVLGMLFNKGTQVGQALLIDPVSNQLVVTEITLLNILKGVRQDNDIVHARAFHNKCFISGQEQLVTCSDFLCRLPARFKSS